MFFTRALLVVFKTTGGRAWNPPGGLRPLTPSQRRNRKKNVELTLKNLSVLKLAAANQPPVPVRLYKPLTFTRVMWMKKQLEETRRALGWGAGVQEAQQAARTAVAGARGLGGGSSSSLLPPAARAAMEQAAQR